MCCRRLNAGMPTPARPPVVCSHSLVPLIRTMPCLDATTSLEARPDVVGGPSGSLDPCCRLHTHVTTSLIESSAADAARTIDRPTYSPCPSPAISWLTSLATISCSAGPILSVCPAHQLRLLSLRCATELYLSERLRPQITSFIASNSRIHRTALTDFASYSDYPTS